VTARSALAGVFVAPIRLYQYLVSPLLGANRCKYHPSCSEYAVLAFRNHGVLKGIAMGTWRILRCNPWSMGGVDYP
jgi:putative membrane protein insertion efficiency factor